MTTIVIMPGGFHPFHAGHLALYDSAREAFPGAEVFVAATNDTSARPFPFAVKEKLAKLAGVAPGHFVQVKSPFRAEEITSKFDPARDRLIFVRSEKDANKPPQAGGVKKDGSAAYLQPLAGQTNIRPFKEHAYMAYLPTVEFGPGMTSATEIRTAWPTLNEKRKTALVMSLYPRTQSNPKLANTVVKLLDAAIGTQNVAEDITEAVGGNYLYYSRETADEAKQILSSGYILGNTTSKQPASYAQTTLPTVSFGRNIGYQISGANVDRDYQVVFVFDRASIETRYKTLGTSQSQTVRGLANPIDTEWGRKVTKLGKAWGLDANADGKVDYKEIGNASKSTASNLVKQGVSTQLNAPKAGGEFEEIVPTKTGKIPLQGLLVGFYLVPGKAASKDPELLNDPRRLDMIRPNQFVKAARPQAVAEDKEKNHWYDAGVKDATRGASPNPRTYLPTLKDKQAKHPEEVDFYMNGYKSVPQGVAEGLTEYKNTPLQDYNGLQFMIDSNHPYLRVEAFAPGSGQQLAQVDFKIDDQDELHPEDLHVEERWRGQGIAQIMYDFVKSKGYTIHRSWSQTDAGSEFWNKHRGQKRVWEQGVAEGSKMLSLDDKIKIYSKHKSQAQQAENRGDYTTADKHKKQASRIYSNIVNLHFGDDGKDAQNAANEYIRKSQGVAEGWSQKYKKSINCSHPKGFSQKAHCAGKRKHNESVETEMVCEDCGMCETHGDHSQTMFGKRYPNCVKNKNESLETYIRKGECPGCGERMVAESQLNEKQDACYHKVKNRYKVWPSAYASGALVQCRKKGAANWGNKSESITQEEYDQLDENLKKWFSDKWVRFGPDGKIRGDCARGSSSEGKPKCLPQSKAHALGKKGRASAGARKRKQDPDANRSGRAINVATKTKSNEDASGVIATKKQARARDPRYSMSLTKDVRPGQIEKNLRAFKLAEQANNNNLMFELFAKFLPLAMRDLGLTMLPKIVPELRIESTDGQASFGRFVDGEMIIQLAMANRHPVDILRTLAHELVHYKQKTLGKIKHDSGETGSPEENQANTIAGIIMRHFNKEYPDAVNMQPIDLNESQVTVNYGIGKNPGKLVKVGADGRVPHAKLHVNVNKKTAKKLGIPHFNEGVADVAKAAAYFIPGVGPAMAAYDVYNAAKTGSAKDVASSLVGFIPGAKGLAAARAINVGKAAYDYQQATADINKPKNTATALAPIQPKDNEFEPIDSTPKNTTAPLAPIQPKDNEIGTVDENFADGRNPGDKGSLKAKVKGKVTMAKARAILKNKNSTPRAKQLAHWFINMNKGRNK